MGARQAPAQQPVTPAQAVLSHSSEAHSSSTKQGSPAATVPRNASLHRGSGNVDAPDRLQLASSETPIAARQSWAALPS
jgi:hypothetical protein